MHNLKTILATAYAVNPYKGSEDGMGWNFIRQIARYHAVVAVTRENNRQQIEQFMQQNPDPLYQRITFLYFDLPYWQRFWKKGSRGALLYFWMWQRAIPAFVRRQNVMFDIAHNVNFHNDWTPSYLWKLKKPFVWGPIGHHPGIPSHFLQRYPRAYKVKDSLAWLVKKCFWNFSGALNNTVKHAAHILCMNSAVSHVINLGNSDWSIMPSVASEDIGCMKNHDGKFTVLSAGRLVPLKGFELTLLAFAQFLQTVNENDKANCELIIVGSGPEEGRYKAIVRAKQMETYVKFIEWIPRTELLALYQRASVFLFPSHEGAGMVVAEALSCGVPVICLDNEGPGEFIDPLSGIAVKAGTVEETVQGLAAAVQSLYVDSDKRHAMSTGARRRFTEHFDWNRRGDRLQQIYQRIPL